MQDYSFMTTEEIFLLQDALKRNKQQIIKFILIGLTLMLIAAFVPQLFISGNNNDPANTDPSLFSFKNVWFWVWLLSFVLVLIFALIKVTDVRYWTIKRDLTKLQKGEVEVLLEGVYHGSNDTKTSFMVKREDSKRKRLFYWMRGRLDDYRSGQQVAIVYARYSRVILDISKK